MDKIVIEGGVPLKGTVEVSGAKNAALPILASALLADGTHQFRNVPELADVASMLEVLGHLGVESRRGEGRSRDRVSLEVTRSRSYEAPYELVRKMRASVLVLGPLLARYGKARVSLPGGCAIGARPIDQHLKGFKALGAEIELSQGYVEARARRLQGAKVTFDCVTVTGTENVMMAAVLAEGRTVLENAAREPEIEELARVLCAMGAKIQGAGSAEILIDGVEKLNPVEHSICPDRIEAGTLLAAAAITGGEVELRKVQPLHLDAVLEKLRAAGCKIAIGADSLHLKAPKTLAAVDVKTQEYPGFPTDMQAQLMAALTVADGTSVISENIFENRFMHVSELQRMGAQVSVNGPTAVVKGVRTLSGAPVMATDLRASASLILAGLRASGKTQVLRVYHLDRGYERLDRKLRGLGARIRRVKD